MHALAPEPTLADPSSLNRLVRTHRPWVEGMARRHLGDPALAEEVTQDVFLRFAGLARRPEQEAALRAWLLRTVWFLAANARRKAAKRRSVEACLASEFEGAADDQTAESLPLEELAAALDSLPELERALVLEHYFEGREHSEIGTRHRLSGEAARKRIARALTHLRAHLTRRGVALPSVSLAAAGLGLTAGSAKACALPSWFAAWLPQTPWKTAGLTAAACAAVAVPVVLHQREEVQALRIQAAAADIRASAAEAAASSSSGWPAGSGVETASWAPQSIDTAGFPNVPRLDQLQSILDSLPSLLAAAGKTSPAPVNLRLKFTMSESLISIISRQNDVVSVRRTRQTEFTGHLQEFPDQSEPSGWGDDQFDSFPNPAASALLPSSTPGSPP